MKTNFAILLLIAALHLSCADESENIESGQPQPFSFNASYLTVISDADMLATAYITDQLGEKEPLDAQDSFYVFRAPFGTSAPFSRQNISNAVTGAVAAISKSIDGRFVFVVETNKPSSVNNAALLSGLAPGSRLSVIDVSNPANPVVTATTDNLFLPLSVDINSAGDLLVVNEVDPALGGVLSFIPFNNGTLGNKTSFPFALLGVAPDPTIPRANGLFSSFSKWNPAGDFIAVNFQDRRNFQNEGEIQFFRVVRNGNAVASVSRHGATQVTGKFPFSGRWSPNGRYYLTNDLYWGFNVDRFFVTTDVSTITVIEFDSASTASHIVKSKVFSGEISEGIAISDDGEWVATANMRGTSLLPDDPLFTRQSSVSLLRFNQQNGDLQKVSEITIDGAILPEGIAFDNTADNLAITTFDYFKPDNVERIGRGAVDFFSVNKSAPSLSFQGRIWTARGLHGIVIH